MSQYGLRQGPQNRQAHQVERLIRKHVVQVLRNEQTNAQARYQKHHLLADVRSGFAAKPGHLVSLNFDSLILEAFPKHSSIRAHARSAHAHKGGGGRRSDQANLFRRRCQYNGEARPTQIWFPHGELSCAESLRLGYRDYGFQPPAYYHAFCSFKKWERRVLQRKPQRGITKRDYWKLLAAVETMDRQSASRGCASGPADHWILASCSFRSISLGLALLPARRVSTGFLSNGRETWPG